jgi:hypothetical protein
MLNTNLGRQHCTVLPDHSSSMLLACEFGRFFCDKIVSLRQLLESQLATTPNCPLVQLSEPQEKLSDLRPVRYAEMLGGLRSSPKKTSPKDVFPNQIWRSCLVELTPLLCEIVNSSLCVGMPEHHKHAIITPLIKKKGSEQNCLSNYRPVSNLSTLSQ